MPDMRRITMPNWCGNEVNISGKVEDVAKLEILVADKEVPFSFNKIIPMPEELRGTISPTRIVSQEEYDNFKLSKDDELLGVGKPITQEMSDRFKKEYGNDNWYDWSNRNWGTKWNVSGGVKETFGDGEIIYKFDTAWCPPEGIYMELSNQFPDVDITWIWEDEEGEGGIL